MHEHCACVCICTRYVFGAHVDHQTYGIVISNGFELLCGCSESNIDQTKIYCDFLLLYKSGYHRVIRNNNSSNCYQGCCGQRQKVALSNSGCDYNILLSYYSNILLLGIYLKHQNKYIII